MHDATAASSGGRLEGMFNRIEQVLILLSGLAILVSGSITFISVFGRWVFGWSIPDGEIMVSDLMIVACVLPLSVVAGRHAHIAVDLVVRHFPDKARRRVDLFNGYLGVLILAAITWSGWLNFTSAWTSNGYYDGRLELPEWPARLTFFVGYLLFAARSLQRAGDAPGTEKSIPPGQHDCADNPQE